MIIKQSKRHILFLKNKSGRSLRRKIRSKRKRKLRRILKASGIMYINKSIPNSSKNRRRKEIELKVPSNFDLFNNQEDVLFFIVKLLNYKTDYRIKTIQLDLVDIDKLDSTAICMLLSVIKELSNIGICVQGNCPINIDCKKMFVESGFLNHMIDDSGNHFSSSKNLIIETGTNKTRNRNIGSVISKAMEFLNSTKKHFQPAYSVAMEIRANSVEHAYKGRKKHWIIGLHKNDDNSVTFTMCDTGCGILSTLQKKYKRDIEQYLFGKTNCDILYRAFERKYGSMTGEVNRNRGLPCILDKFQSGYIKGLKVLTNDVFLDFKTKSNNRLLNSKFPGVLFSWVIDNDCINL